MAFTPPPTPEARRLAGRTLRDRLPRSGQGEFRPRRRDALKERLLAAVAGRDEALLPHRWARMAESPWAFFRGTASLMAEDLRPLPNAGLHLTLCGDAHLLNLGAYADPDRSLLFDLNDFDEACSGPFEWDLKRLAASFLVACDALGLPEREGLDAARTMAKGWRETLAACAELPFGDLARLEVRPEDGHAALAPIFEKAARDTPDRLREKGTEPDSEGWPRFRDQAPALRPLSSRESDPVMQALVPYAITLPAPWRHVLSAYQPAHAARRASGCGSYGVPDWLVVLVGRDARDLLFLELKGQLGSCWKPTSGHRGQTVAHAAQVLQTWSDPFLGWSDVEGVPVLVRQWSDHKASLDLEDLRKDMSGYALLCGRVLAKAQSRAGDAAVLAGYAGRGEHLDEAMARFARAYLDQVRMDVEAFQALLRSGALAKA